MTIQTPQTTYVVRVEDVVVLSSVDDVDLWVDEEDVEV